MLVLTRREGEALTIGGKVTITVVEIRGSQVRLGINAPADVRIDREEVAKRKADERLG